MAIKKKGSKAAAPALPARLAELSRKALLSSAYQKAYEAICKPTKEEIKAYIQENSDGFTLDLDVSKSFTAAEGRITWTTRETTEVDKDAIIALIKSGKVTLETIIGCANFSQEALKISLGTSYDSAVKPGEPTEFLTLNPSAETKAEVADTIEELFGKALDASSPAASVPAASVPVAPISAPVSAPPVVAVEEKKSRSKKAKAASDVPATGSDDLDAILGKK